MPAIIEPATLGDGLKWEESNYYSRKKITVLSGSALSCLEVVGQVTASGKYVALNPVAADGSEVAAGFMAAPVDASAADTAGVIINGHAMAAMDNLKWPDAIDPADKTTAIGQLEALGIRAVDLA
jgi:hypothetical protein